MQHQRLLLLQSLARFGRCWAQGPERSAADLPRSSWGSRPLKRANKESDACCAITAPAVPRLSCSFLIKLQSNLNRSPDCWLGQVVEAEMEVSHDKLVTMWRQHQHKLEPHHKWGGLEG